MNIHLYSSVNLIDVEYIIPNISIKEGSRGGAPGGLGAAQPKVKFSPAFFKRRWGPGARPLVGLGKAQFFCVVYYICFKSIV